MARYTLRRRLATGKRAGRGRRRLFRRIGAQLRSLSRGMSRLKSWRSRTRQLPFTQPEFAGSCRSCLIDSSFDRWWLRKHRNLENWHGFLTRRAAYLPPPASCPVRPASYYLNGAAWGANPSTCMNSSSKSSTTN
jgi:hypothetical protein